MKKWAKRLLYTLAGILVFWTVLTVWAEYSGSGEEHLYSPNTSQGQALVIYNPDPIYDLDAQICQSFAKGLAESGYTTLVSTTDWFTGQVDSFDLVVVCANTYNWAPDWATIRFIDRTLSLDQKPVVAITLGSGSTQRSQHLLEEALNARGSQLIDSKSFWLMRPNDEARMDESNVFVANDLAHEWARSIRTQ